MLASMIDTPQYLRILWPAFTSGQLMKSLVANVKHVWILLGRVNRQLHDHAGRVLSCSITP